MSSANKGKAFFKRADEVAETGNWDFAIELYTEGLQRDPGNIEHGYNKLREVAIKRKAQGGKSPGMMEQLKRRAGKDPAQNLVNSCYLWAKDPGAVFLMEQVINAAKTLELNEVVEWMAKILFEANRTSPKPQKRYYVFLTDVFEDLKNLKLALEACRAAFDLNREDTALENRVNKLMADFTIQQGQYDQEGDFLKGVRDLDKQKELLQKDSLVKSDDYKKQMILKTRHEYEETPTVRGKITGYVDALLATEDPEDEQTAIDVLEEAFQKTEAYQFKMKIGDIRIRQLTNAFRKAKASGDAEAAKKAYIDQLKFEIKEYEDRVKNYPTDLGIKCELGRRLFIAGRYDDAIAVLQQAQRDPQRKLVVANYLGQAFMKKQWWQEAIDTFEKVLAGEVSEERAKDLRYNLALCYEEKGILDKAEENYSAIAQMDFNFRDVRDRLQGVRERIKAQSN